MNNDWNNHELSQNSMNMVEERSKDFLNTIFLYKMASEDNKPRKSSVSAINFPLIVENIPEISY